MRYLIPVILGCLLTAPVLGQTRGFEPWTQELFVLMVYIDDKSDHVTPYVWLYNPTSHVVEMDESSMSMTDVSGAGMERSLSQSTGTHVSLGAGMSRICYPLFWKNRGRSPGTFTFRSGDGVKYAVQARAGTTSSGAFGQLPKALREAARLAYKSALGGRLLDSGQVREKPQL